MTSGSSLGASTRALRELDASRGMQPLRITRRGASDVRPRERETAVGARVETRRSPAVSRSRRSDRPPSRPPYMLGVNMMCAFGVPGNMIHGDPRTGFACSPVVSAVAYGM